MNATPTTPEDEENTVTGALHGRTALVIGGAGGIGSASAAALLRDGASITIMSRGEAKIAAAADELTPLAPAGATVGYIAGDAQKQADLAAAVAHARGEHGLDICVSTVGRRGNTKPILLNDAETFTDELRINITSAFITIKHCISAMAEAGGGSIVFTSSVIAEQSYPNMAGYCAGKAGLEGLVRAAADEVSHLQIRINCVRPGLVRVPGNPEVAGLFSGDRERMFVEQIPMGRTGVPDDVAAGIRYLAGSESSWATGTSLPLDGGNHLRRAPDVDRLLRERFGDATIDAVRAGRVLE